MLTLITPTRFRPRQFALLEKYIARQTYCDKFQWLVVVDGGIEKYSFTMGQEVIARDASKDPSNRTSICLNYGAALPLVKGSKIALIEDDDFLAPEYLKFITESLDTVALTGYAPALYFHIQARKWRDMKNKDYCSLAATAFTNEVLPLFRQLTDLPNCIFLDGPLWKHWLGAVQGTYRILENSFSKPMHVGIKGLSWGAPGLGLGHDAIPGMRDINVFKRWLGNDWRNYYYDDLRTR